MQPASFRQRITLKDIFKADFWRYLAKSIWLFFPSIIFLVMAWFCFWQITQGKDLMQITLENPYVFAYFIIAEVFWVYITWYTSRIIGKIKMYQEPDAPYIWKRFLTQMPRLLAFSCLSVIVLAFFKLRYDPSEKFGWLFIIILFLTIPIYFLVYQIFSNLADKADKINDKARQRRYLNNFLNGSYVALGVPFVLIIFAKSYFFLLVLLVGLQAGLLMLLVMRRKRIFLEEKSFFEQSPAQHGFTEKSNVLRKVRGFAFDEEDRFYTKIFIFIIAAGLFVYLRTVFSVSFAVKLGAFPFVLLAFGVLLMLGNVVTLFSVLGRFNFHLFLLIIAFIVGLITEPHFTYLPAREGDLAIFSQRKDLKEFFRDWIETRKQEIDSSTKPYPVFFVLSDGGASRSGYWVASVLAKLEDTTGGRFSRHLFCLSGASGGSVGNTTFFNLLRLRSRVADSTGSAPTNLAIVHDYLESDFLTYTLARMLGPDVFRHIFPFPFIDNRAAALALALEQASGKNSILYDSMAVPFSRLVTQKNQSYSLPLLFINTTRMQDGRPAIISNISIVGDDRFNRRIDLLDLLPKEKDLKLSTAVVLGASFPYVSPAGRIDSKNNRDSITRSHYFVDGGYFDNSGSGVVNETISILLRDSLYLQYKDKIHFYIIHINNEPGGEAAIEKVNPLINDLAAPIKTLMGSYGSQTTVNDERLRNFMRTLYNDNLHYKRINLYDDGENITYSMNWVISDTLLNAMKRSLEYNRELRMLIGELRR